MYIDFKRWRIPDKVQKELESIQKAKWKKVNDTNKLLNYSNFGMSLYKARKLGLVPLAKKRNFKYKSNVGK